MVLLMGWLSDKRFAEQYIFSKKIKYGIKKIAYELKIRGVNELIISEAIGSIRGRGIFSGASNMEKEI